MTEHIRDLSEMTEQCGAYQRSVGACQSPLNSANFARHNRIFHVFIESVLTVVWLPTWGAVAAPPQLLGNSLWQFSHQLQSMPPPLLLPTFIWSLCSDMLGSSDDICCALRRRYNVQIAEECWGYPRIALNLSRENWWRQREKERKNEKEREKEIELIKTERELIKTDNDCGQI